MLTSCPPRRRAHCAALLALMFVRGAVLASRPAEAQSISSSSSSASGSTANGGESTGSVQSSVDVQVDKAG